MFLITNTIPGVVKVQLKVRVPVCTMKEHRENDRHLKI